MVDAAALDQEKFAAASAVLPLLGVPAFGVFAVEEVIAPSGIGDALGLLRPLDVSLAVASEFDLLALLLAIRAVDSQHGIIVEVGLCIVLSLSGKVLVFCFFAWAIDSAGSGKLRPSR